jgi:hypothetical protein
MNRAMHKYSVPTNRVMTTGAIMPNSTAVVPRLSLRHSRNVNTDQPNLIIAVRVIGVVNLLATVMLGNSGA